MSTVKIIYGVFLSTILTTSTLAQDSPLKFLTGVSTGIVDLGRTNLCLASKSDSPEFKAKVYHAFDVTVAGIKKNVDGPLTEEKYAALLRILVVDAAKILKSVDPQCDGYCPQNNADSSYLLKEIGDAGEATEAMGLTISCMLDDPKPEVLGQIALTVGAGMQAVAANTDSSKTSAEILSTEMKAIVKNLQKLSSRCVNIKRKC